MTPDLSQTNPQSIWKNQPIGQRPMTAAEVRERARRYGRRKRTEAIVSIALGVLAVAIGLVVELFVLTATMPRLIVGAAIVLMGVAIRREALQPGLNSTSAACLEFYRKALELRRRQLAISIDLWFGVAAFIALLVRPLPGIPWYFYVMLGSLLALLFAVRFRGARKARREIDAVNELLAAD
jgi:membrane protein implicated in regulation of membrane protease activity